MTTEEAIEKYPGLREEFVNWYLATSVSLRESPKFRDETWVGNAWIGFNSGSRTCGFLAGMNPTGITRVDIPPRLIALRDMSLI